MTEAQIISRCRESLAAHQVPGAVSFVDDLSRTWTGKIMHRVLRDR